MQLIKLGRSPTRSEPQLPDVVWPARASWAATSGKATGLCWLNNKKLSLALASRSLLRPEGIVERDRAARQGNNLDGRLLGPACLTLSLARPSFENRIAIERFL